jgi:hypothetical protein
MNDLSEEKKVNVEEESKKGKEKVQFECSICFESPSEPVVTKCGHLFW